MGEGDSNIPSILINFISSHEFVHYSYLVLIAKVEKEFFETLNNSKICFECIQLTFFIRIVERKVDQRTFFTRKKFISLVLLLSCNNYTNILLYR